MRRIPITQDEVVRYAEWCDEDEIVKIVQAWAMEQQDKLLEADYEATTGRVLERIKTVFNTVPRMERNIGAFESDALEKFKQQPVEVQDKILALLNGDEDNDDEDENEPIGDQAIKPE
jgi:hypothetical protein